ncbi:terpene synthase family protein [Streptomyces sp. URMC 127]|uniref:terpene synthase family protein n=1 Tax=Streptomyces sp. URMC 127 TaxID=3423402 RepID=UPI003F19A31E
MALTVAEKDLPSLYCPLESAINKRVRHVGNRAVRWIAESGMCASEDETAWVVATHSTDFFARFAPVSDDDRLLATSLWVYWGFAFDDARCDNGPLSTRPAQFNALAGRVQRAAEAPTAADGGERFIPALQDIIGRFRSFGSPVLVRRFLHAQRAWLSGVAWQVGNQGAGRMPDVDDYLAMRLLSCGGEPTFAMLELATGLEMTDEELHRPAVRALTEMAIMVAGLDNDRHSLRKEMSRGHTDQNLYNVLMHHRQMSLPEAIEAATRIRDRILVRFMHLHDRVRPGAGEALGSYLQGLRYGIRGNAEWGLRVPRYLSLGRVPDPMEEAPLQWAEAPLDGCAMPLPDAPCLAWWWDEDLA